MIRWLGAFSMVRSARRHMATFLHARLSFPSSGMYGLLCGPIASWHVSKMLFSAREHLAPHWLDLAEGRLRLDRLTRNGGGEPFFPWASPIPRETRKSHRRHPPLRFGPSGCGVDRLRLSDRHRGRGGRGARKQQGEVTWLTSAHSRNPARNSRAKSS